MAKTNKQNQNQNQKEISKDCKKFATATFKKYWKKEGDRYDSKKEARRSFVSYLIDLLPETIFFIVRYGYIKDENIKEAREGVYAKLVNKEFLKGLKKEIKDGSKITNINLLPIIIRDIMAEIDAVNKSNLAANPSAELFEVSDTIEISKLILKKKLKKMEKAGIDESIAFDVLSIIPCKEAMKFGQGYRIHSLYECLYTHAKNKVVPFAKIMETVVPEELYPSFVTYALLERKEKFGQLTEAQKSFYLDVSNWVFDTMENMDRSELALVLETYVRNRKRDEAQGKDGNRRYYLSSLVEADYPHIVKAVRKMIADDDNVKKYF